MCVSVSSIPGHRLLHCCAGWPVYSWAWTSTVPHRSLAVIDPTLCWVAKHLTTWAASSFCTSITKVLENRCVQSWLDSEEVLYKCVITIRLVEEEQSLQLNLKSNCGYYVFVNLFFFYRSGVLHSRNGRNVSVVWSAVWNKAGEEDHKDHWS